LVCWEEEHITNQNIQDTLQQLAPPINPAQVAALAALGLSPILAVTGGPIGTYNNFVDKYYSSGDAFADIAVALGIGGYQATSANLSNRVALLNAPLIGLNNPANLISGPAVTGIIPVSRTGTSDITRLCILTISIKYSWWY
jgi:hypothetical protein